MKYHLYSIISMSLFLSCSDIKQESTKKNLFIENEIVAVVLMKSNDKTTEEISNFSSFYVDLVQQREPNTYAWSHFQKGDNIVLIERYKDEAAHLNHIKNISPGGISEKEFGQFLEHFEILEIDIYGTVSNEFKSVIDGFNLPTSYNPTIAKYSRN